MRAYPHTFAAPRLAALLGISFAAAALTGCVASPDESTSAGDSNLYNFCGVTPGLDQCNDAGYRQLCANQVPYCVDMLRAEFNRNWTAQPQTTTMVPAGTTHAGRQTQGKVVRYDYSKLAIRRDADLTFASIMQQARVPASLLSNGFLRNIDLGVAYTQPIHPEWESDGPGGNGVFSCQEYVYKKWYDYDRFEDAAATCRGHFGCIYDLAMMTATPGVNHTLRTRQGTTGPAQIPVDYFGAVGQQLKNKWYLESIGDFGYYIGLTSAPLRATIVGAAAQAQPYTVDNRWTWHQQMHAAQAPEQLTEDDYASIEERTNAYVRLIRQYESQKAVLAGSPDLNKILHPEMYDACGRPIVVGVPPRPICRGPFDPVAWYDPATAAGQLVTTMSQIGQMLVSEWNHVSTRDGVTVDHGCLDPNSARCDWAPKMFAGEYVRLFQRERERDFQTCVLYTGNNFSVWQQPGVDPHMDPSVDLVDSDHLEAWFVKASNVGQEMAKELPWKNGNSLTIGDNAPGGKTIGDDAWFSVNYNYGGSWDWTFSGYPSAICGANLSSEAKLSADVHVLKQPMQIIDADVRVTASDADNTDGTGSGHFYVMDQSFALAHLWDQPQTNVNAGKTIAYSNSTTTTKDAPPIIFPVLGVNVKLTASASMTMGLTANGFAYGKACSTGPIATSNAGLANQTLINESATITPFARVDASVSASIDEGIVSLGVRGNVNLINASLPLNTQASLAYRNDGVAMFNVNNTGSLVLEELSGDVRAFAEVCYAVGCDDVEVELFSWDGFHQSFPLYDRSKKSWPLADVILGLNARSAQIAH